MKKIIKKMDWIFPLIARLSIGIVFLQSGWGKLHSIDRVIIFFTELKIPFPMAQAYLVSGVELVGGVFLILGLFTRLTVLPLITIMIVAILTAKKVEITEYTDILGFTEYLYIVLLGWIGVGGAGTISIDKFLKRD